ncbi:MAG: hypothetical protein LW822_08425 [Phycisphaeraceae bacterium]|nr:hypothetical protein [Phycisphaeraceae bacterium]
MPDGTTEKVAGTFEQTVADTGWVVIVGAGLANLYRAGAEGWPGAEAGWCG